MCVGTSLRSRTSILWATSTFIYFVHLLFTLVTTIIYKVSSVKYCSIVISSFNENVYRKRFPNFLSIECFRIFPVSFPPPLGRAVRPTALHKTRDPSGWALLTKSKFWS